MDREQHRYVRLGNKALEAMKIADLPFGMTDWSQVEATEHPGLTGKAIWRTRHFGELRARMVEYTPGYQADHALAPLQAMNDPTSLREILYLDWAELQQARHRLDRILIDWCAALKEEDLARPFSYQDFAGPSPQQAFRWAGVAPVPASGSPSGASHHLAVARGHRFWRGRFAGNPPR